MPVYQPPVMMPSRANNAYTPTAMPTRVDTPVAPVRSSRVNGPIRGARGSRPANTRGYR